MAWISRRHAAEAGADVFVDFWLIYAGSGDPF